MSEYKVTYQLTPEQEAKIQAIADENKDEGQYGTTVEKVFEMMMMSGSRWDIDDRINVWKRLHENRKQDCSGGVT